MKKDEQVVKPVTLERNLSDALTLCERASERCIRIAHGRAPRDSVKVRSAKKVEEK